MVHVLHFVEKSALLVHVVHPSILLLHDEHAVLLDLYFPEAQAAQVDPLTIYIPPHVVHLASVVEQAVQLL